MFASLINGLSRLSNHGRYIASEMRTIFTMTFALILVGCQPSAPSSRQMGAVESHQTETLDTKLVGVPNAGDMHTDEFIESLVGFDITAKFGGIDPEKQILNVVPAGESHLRAEVFKKLKLDESRLTNFRTTSMNMVDFITWQVSPSYDITCMSANNDPCNDGLKVSDPNRKVYGIRLSLTEP